MEIAFAALVVGVASLLVLVRFLPLWVSAAVVAVKITVFMLYFGWLFDGQWVLLDDISYWEYGRELLSAGYTPWSALLHRDGLTMLFIISGGFHILYTWWNLFAQYLLGPFYFAPVALNVGLTAVAAWYLFRLARLDGFGVRYSQGLAVFFLLHWDVLVWSSLVNLKDVLVMTLVIAACYHFVRLAGAGAGVAVRHRAASLVGLAVTMALLPWIRFYIPVILIGCGGLWVLLKRQGWAKYGLLAAAVAAFFLVLPGYIPHQYVSLNPAAAAYGTLRFALTPQPWSIEPGYSFLTVPSLLHWALFAPSIVAGAFLWRRSPAASLLILFLAATTVFYGMVPLLQEPRHRFQMAFVWVWLQYHCIFEVIRYVARHRAEYDLRGLTPALRHRYP